MGIIIGAFVILLPYIDIDALLIDLADAGITPTVFPFVALYILFGNSLLEEFFFRGLLPIFSQNPVFVFFCHPSFLPFTISPFSYHGLALHFSLLAVTGLWIGGIIFQLANERSRTFCLHGQFTCLRISVFCSSGYILFISIEKAARICVQLFIYSSSRTLTVTLNKSPSTSIVIFPSCKSTMDCAMARPSPEPSV